MMDKALRRVWTRNQTCRHCRNRLLFELLEERRLLSINLPPEIFPLDSLQIDPDRYDDASILVRFQPGFAAAAARGETDQNASILQGADVGRQLAGVPGLHKVTLPDNLDVTRALSAYQKNLNVVYAQPNYRVSIADTYPNDLRFDEMWPLHNAGQTGGQVDADIDAPRAWDVTQGNGTTVVAVIDSGVDYTHPDLAANMWVNPDEIPGDGLDNDQNGYVDDVHGYDFKNGDGDPMDDQGHGTHVAGTIGAVGNNGSGVTGVSWNVQIMALKFIGVDGSGYESDAIEAVYYALDNGATISNNSWGGDPYSPALYDALATARDAEHIFVAAAGNGNQLGIGQDNDATLFYPASYDLDNVIAVSAVDQNDNLAGFSNYGAATVDLAAPGVNILSTTPGGGYGLNSGTSMAAPHVTGVAALVQGLHSDWSYSEIVGQVLSTAEPNPGLYGLNVTGGRLNAAAAVGNPEPSPPAPEPGSLPVAEDFDDGVADYFLPQAGAWQVAGDRYNVTPVAENHDLVAMSTLDVAGPLPADLEIRTTINADEGYREFLGFVLSDYLTNGYIFFDYQSPDEFKFAGADIRSDSWIIGAPRLRGMARGRLAFRGSECEHEL